MLLCRRALGRPWVRTLATPASIVINGTAYPTDEWTNVPALIIPLADRKLHLDPNHPIGILRALIEKRFGSMGYTFYNEFQPVVTVHDNFDVLGFPEDHVGRLRLDTYYVNKNLLLRTHTLAHEVTCFKECPTPGYFISADVYRRDEIDRTHYPAFHQMEGARVWKRGAGLEQQLEADIAAIPRPDLVVEDVVRAYDPAENPKQEYMTDREVELVGAHLRRTLELVVGTVFQEAQKAAVAAGSTEEYLNEPLRVRWVEAYFPWTAPLWEIEVWWKGEWLECCGCGVVRKQVLDNSGVEDLIGWAFGVGLDRIAMLLFGIPDIRLFWTRDERFGRQFAAGEISTFVPYSKYPLLPRDVLFWNLELPVHLNDLMEVVRGVGGDLVESVKLVDDFVHPKSGRRLQCYRINYQSMDRNITNEEVNRLQKEVEEQLVERFAVEIR